MTIPIDSNSEAVRRLIREGYSQIAKSGGSCGSNTPSCCGSSANASEQLAKYVGYSVEELGVLPEGANMGLSCGNPNALAALQPGEVVLDLGSGGGFDVFIAAKKVGTAGRAIGVDMTAEMLSKARKNIPAYRERSGLDNVEFRLGEIEHLPVADASVDVIISNCVINLSPDKPQVWREIARVLKPGGRVAVSDLALLKPLPPSVSQMIEAVVGCVAGAVLVSEIERMATDVGLVDIKLKAKSGYVDGMADWKDPLYQKILAELPTGSKPGDYITSLEVTASKAMQRAVQSTKPSTRVVEVYDPAMCCSTGVCGPEIDPKLVQFAADLKWLQEQGVEVRRFNLAQSPDAFVDNERVKSLLTEKGEAALPLCFVNGKPLAIGHYPQRSALATALGVVDTSASVLTPAILELAAIATAIGTNCEPCFKYHYHLAQLLGVSKADMARTIELASTVKDSPHQAILRLADKLTGTSLSNPASVKDRCCGEKDGPDKLSGTTGTKTSCCC